MQFNLVLRPPAAGLAYVCADKYNSILFCAFRINCDPSLSQPINVDINTFESNNPLITRIEPRRSYILVVCLYKYVLTFVDSEPTYPSVDIREKP